MKTKLTIFFYLKGRVRPSLFVISNNIVQNSTNNVEQINLQLIPRNSLVANESQRPRVLWHPSDRAFHNWPRRQHMNHNQILSPRTAADRDIRSYQPHI